MQFHGHPGLVRSTLDLLQSQYRHGLTDVLGILRYLVSGTYRDAIQQSRALFSQPEAIYRQ